MKLLPILFVLPFLVTHLADAAAAQNPEKSQVVSLSDIRLESYQPQYLAAKDLYPAADRTVGRSLYIAERGGEFGEAASNLTLLADRILVYDEPKYVEVILAALGKLDQPSAANLAPEALVSTEYAPRYITLESVNSALRSFDNRYSGVQGAVTRPQNVSFVEERNLVILRDAQARIDEMLAILRSIDVPEPQAMLTCYVVSAGAAGGLPQELEANMKKLLPELEFGAAGFGMLRSSVAPGRTLALRIEGEEHSFDLGFSPVAYDPATGSLTIKNCRLERDEYQSVFNGTETQRQFSGRRQVFNTNAVLRGGEYTVLGSTGPEPLFLVLRLTPLQ